MARAYDFVQVDVFTDRIFGGNQLAVFLDGRGLSDREMQQIAQEMNFAETTFLLPPTQPDAAARVRIFTPGQEVPFAGHPTIGTSFVLASRGFLPEGSRALVLEEGVGPISVRFEEPETGPTFFWMRHPEPSFTPPTANRQVIAAALGLTESDLLPGAPIEVGTTGLPFLFVPLRDRATVDRAVTDTPSLLRSIAGTPALGIFFFAPDADPAARSVYSRMFAPGSGVPEDPATGSASGPLGAYLVRHNLVAPGADIRITSEQGTKMGRQSFIHIAIGMAGDAITRIEVGGSAVPVLDGTLRLPD
jgi:trans-2,3-dihydro-3-hydroxyanthranilate isomerase